MGMKCIRVARELGANMNTLEATARNLKDNLEIYKRRLVQITEQLVDRVIPQSKDGKLLYASTFDMLDDSTLMKKAGEIIKKPETIVVFINANNNGSVLLACNDKLQVNCSSILKSVLSKFGGKGGGKPNFATGSVSKEKVHEILGPLLKELNLE